jgi:hypothetical protein
MRRRDVITAARRRGGVAARGARAAARADAADRRALELGRGRSRISAPHDGVRRGLEPLVAKFLQHAFTQKISLG